MKVERRTRFDPTGKGQFRRVEENVVVASEDEVRELLKLPVSVLAQKLREALVTSGMPDLRELERKFFEARKSAPRIDA